MSASRTTPVPQSLANGGGLAELSRFPDGVAADRGDGFNYFKGREDMGMRFRQPTSAGAVAPDIKDLKKDTKEVIAARVRNFDLSDVEDMFAYQRVLNDCANGFAEFADREKVYDESIKSWRVLLHWYEFLLESKR